MSPTRFRAFQTFLLQGLLIALGGLATTPGIAQTASNRLDSLRMTGSGLEQRGFENVSVFEEGGVVTIQFENNLYRYDARALWEVMRDAPAYLRSSDTVHLVPLRLGIPLETVEIPASALTHGSEVLPAIEAVYDVQEERDDQAVYESRNTNFLKADIVLVPQIVAEFGNFTEPVQTQINLAPQVRFGLWKGAQAVAQWIIPVHNQLEDEGDHMRPGLLVLHQMYRLPYNTFVAATAGHFTNDRYGLDVEARTFLARGRLAVGARGGYTGFARYNSGEWVYDDMRLFYPSASIEAFLLPKYDLSVEVTYGKYLADETGWRLDVRRHFGEVDIHLFAVVNDLVDGTQGEDVGFAFRIPLPVRKYARPGRVRFRPDDSFFWEYRYKGMDEGGYMYRTGYNLRDLHSELAPVSLRERLKRISTGRRGFKW